MENMSGLLPSADFVRRVRISVVKAAPRLKFRGAEPPCSTEKAGTIPSVGARSNGMVAWDRFSIGNSLRYTRSVAGPDEVVIPLTTSRD